MKVLLVDGNPLMWRAAFGRGEQEVANTILSLIYTSVNRFRPNGVVVCWDVGKSKWRTDLFPEYKAKRHEQREKIDYELAKSQAELARTYLRSIGIPQLAVDEHEADDILSWLSEYFMDTVKVDETIIVTGDKDLWQLVRTEGGRRITVYDSLQGRWVDEDFVIEELGIEPYQIPEVKALQGDSSDGIPGIKRVGEKTAIKLISEYNTVFNFPENKKELNKKKTTAQIIKNFEDVELFYTLTKSPKLWEATYLLGNKTNDLVEQLNKPYEFDEDTKIFVRKEISKLIELNEKTVPPIQEALKPMTDFLRIQNKQEYTIENLDASILSCNDCPLRAHCEIHGPTLPEGHPEAKIMVIGRNPGRNELVEHRPFCGDSGVLVDELLGQVGLERKHCWITNINKCYSRNNRPTTYAEQECCLQYLRAEVELIKPKLIIALGNEAMSAVTPYQNRVLKHCGEILDDPIGRVGQIDWGCKVLVSVHPSKALRDDEGKSHWDFASSKLKELMG